MMLPGSVILKLCPFQPSLQELIFLIYPLGNTGQTNVCFCFNVPFDISQDVIVTSVLSALSSVLLRKDLCLPRFQYDQNDCLGLVQCRV